MRYFSLTRLLRPLQDDDDDDDNDDGDDDDDDDHHHQDRDKTLTLVPKETPSTLAKNLEAEHNTIL